MPEYTHPDGAQNRSRVRKIMLQKDIRPLERFGNLTLSWNGNFSIVEHRRNGCGSHFWTHGIFTTKEEAERHIDEIWESVYDFMSAYEATPLNDEIHIGKVFKYFSIRRIPDIIGFAITVEYDFDVESANANRLKTIRNLRRIERMWDSKMRITGFYEPVPEPPPIS